MASTRVKGQSADSQEPMCIDNLSQELMCFDSREQTPEVDACVWNPDELQAFEEHKRFHEASLVYIEKVKTFQPANKPNVRKVSCQHYLMMEMVNF